MVVGIEDGCSRVHLYRTTQVDSTSSLDPKGRLLCPQRLSLRAEIQYNELFVTLNILRGITGMANAAF